jgi:hypothetical protein
MFRRAGTLSFDRAYRFIAEKRRVASRLPSIKLISAAYTARTPPGFCSAIRDRTTDSGNVCLPPVDETPSNLTAYALSGSADDRSGDIVMSATTKSSNKRGNWMFFNSV